MNVRVYHQATSKGGVVDICIDIEMPFLPAPALMIKPTAGSDFLEVDDVYWSIEFPDFVEAHIDQGENTRLYPLKDMIAEGWRKS